MTRLLALALIAAFAATADADVIELKTGQRVEGALKQATPASVTVEVGGQTITFESEKVRAIYFGAAPNVVVQPSSRDEAMKALKALRSVAQGGIAYRDYASRANDAKIIVDRYLDESQDSAERTAIREAIEYYTYASKAWNAYLSGDVAGFRETGMSPLIKRCPALTAELERSRQEKAFLWRNTPSDPATAGIVLGGGGVPVIWSCAADKIAEAEKLLSGTPLAESAKLPPGTPLAAEAGKLLAGTPLLVLSLDEGDSVKGGESARVVLVEFTDHQCPFCARHARDTLPQLEADYVKTGKLRYVTREFPLESIHPQAFKAAEAALCAGDEGKYWEMHARLFAHQYALAPKQLGAHAQAVGLDEAKFTQCLNGSTKAAKVRRNLAEGAKAGITGTPSFFLGVADGSIVKVMRIIKGARPFPMFKEAIDAALEAQGTQK